MVTDSIPLNHLQEAKRLNPIALMAIAKTKNVTTMDESSENVG